MILPKDINNLLKYLTRMKKIFVIAVLGLMISSCSKHFDFQEPAPTPTPEPTPTPTSNKATQEEINANVAKVGNSTGITLNELSQKPAATYFDLQGRRVAKPAKGLYINNGRKVVIK